MASLVYKPKSYFLRFWPSNHYDYYRPKSFVFATQWAAFSFPDEGNFNARSIIHPGWLIYFFVAGTDTQSPVSINGGGSVLHANPVKIDRYGRLPTIYINTLVTYDISIRNEFGVEKHVINDYSKSYSASKTTYKTTSADYAPKGNTVVRAQGTLQIRLSDTPKDEEFVVVIHDGSYGDTVTVTDGSGTDTITVPGTVIRYTYSANFNQYVRGL